MKEQTDGTGKVEFKGAFNEVREHGGDSVNGVVCERTQSVIRVSFRKSQEMPAGQDSQPAEGFYLHVNGSFNPKADVSVSESVYGVYQKNENNVAVFYQADEAKPCRMDLSIYGQDGTGTFECKNLKRSSRQGGPAEVIEAKGNFSCKFRVVD